MSDNFWLNKPNILLDKEHISEIWPTDDLEYSEKLNACTRLILLLALLGYFLTKSVKIPITALVTIGIIIILYKSKAGKNKRKEQINDIKENFRNINDAYEENKEDFIQPTKENPLMNVLLPEIKNNPERKPAAPSNNEEMEIKINENASNIGLDKKLFRDLGDSISFDHSMRNFYTMPNTQIPNNQKKFAEFCYGNMPSCKDVENKDRMFC